jgi:Cu(I)/Ag(I) efflux system membrane protein CusA/SilA
VYGKAGRADTSLDPAPFSMVETVVVLKPKEEWSKKERWFSFLPDFTHFLFRWIWNDRITYDELISRMNEKMQIPGWTNAFTMPIRGRIDMLSTGIRTPIGIKVQGADLKEIEQIGRQIEKSLENVPGTRSVFAERVTGGYYLDFDLRREDLARYGLTVDDAQQILQLALGGETLTVTVEGRERYPVHLRYQPAFRQDLAALRRILVPTPSGAHIPMSQIADIHVVQGPSMIRDENGLLTGYVYVDIEGRDIGGYVKEAKQVVLDQVNVPNGYTLSWSGQYENMQRVEERLKIVLPLTLFLVVLLIHFNTKSWPKTGIVLLAVPFSLVGAIWFLWLLDYNVSIAVWVGMIALMGLDAETGTFMLLFLDLSYNDAKKKGMLRNEADLREAILHGAVKRVRPKIMTVASAFLGLIPILWSDGTGSDLMKRIAAPMVGGLITSFVLELLIYPVLYEMWRLRELKGEHNALRSAATGLDMTPTVSESLYENRAKARKKKPRDKQ